MRSDVVFCTITTISHSARVQVLAESCAATHPGVPFHALVVDAHGSAPDFEFGPSATLDVPRGGVVEEGLFLEMAAMYTPLELCCALKPFYVKWFLDKGYERVLYLDGDTWVLDDLSSFVSEAERCGVVLTPHVSCVLEPARESTDVEGVALTAGLVNMGVFACAPAATPFLDWWASRLARECIDDPIHQRYVDQRWVDIAIPIFQPHLTRDRGVNVGWWSFAGLSAPPDAAGPLNVAGYPVRVLHMSGFDPERPWLFSVHAGDRPHLLLSANPLLRDLCARYAALLEAAGDADRRAVPYGFAELSNGVSLDARIRRIYRTAVWMADRGLGSAPPSPLKDPTAFAAWLAEPTGALAAVQPLSRYLRAVYDDVPGMVARFPRVDGEDGRLFREWCLGEGVLLHAVQKGLVAHEPEDVRPRAGAWPTSQRILIVADADGSIACEDDCLPRALTVALDAAGIPSVTVEATEAGESTQASRRIAKASDFGFDAVILAARSRAIAPLHHSVTVGDPRPVPRLPYVMWPYSGPPPNGISSLAGADHVLVPSSFSADGVRVLGVTPLVVGLPITPVVRPRGVGDVDWNGKAPPMIYAPVSLDGGGCRWRPEALIKGIQIARDAGYLTRLVVGLRGGERWVQEAERWRVAAAPLEWVEVVDIPERAPHAGPWLGLAHAVLSLHRTDAFCWTGALAMASGIPVVATAYGGNLDYMDDTNSWLVEPETLDEVRCPGVPAGSLLATVNPESVAAAIADLADDHQGRVARILRAQSVAERFAPARVGSAIQRAIEAAAVRTGFHDEAGAT